MIPFISNSRRGKITEEEKGLNTGYLGVAVYRNVDWEEEKGNFWKALKILYILILVMVIGRGEGRLGGNVYLYSKNYQAAHLDECILESLLNVYYISKKIYSNIPCHKKH